VLASSDPEGKFLTNTKNELESFFTAKQGFTGISRINYQDGIRIWFANGDIAHLRPSGNAPQFRVYSNPTTQTRATEIVNLCLAEPDGIVLQMKQSV
jgi:phosphomannomutase